MSDEHFSRKRGPPTYDLCVRDDEGDEDKAVSRTREVNVGVNVGVCKVYGKYRASCGHFFDGGDSVCLGTFATVEEAKNAYNFARANKKALVQELKNMQKKERNEKLRERCKTQTL